MVGSLGRGAAVKDSVMRRLLLSVSGGGGREPRLWGRMYPCKFAALVFHLDLLFACFGGVRDA